MLAAAAETSRSVVVTPAGIAPLLSAAYWWMALRMALTSLDLLVLLAWENCRAGFKAIKTIASKTAKMPMTIKSSTKVNPFRSLGSRFMYVLMIATF